MNNNAVSTAEAELTPLSGGRVADARELRAMALRVKDHVKANLLWKKHARAIGAAADAVRGYRPTKKAAAPSSEAGSVPPKPKRRGSGPQYSYANLAKLFAKLITRLTKIAGYVAMTGSGLTIAELSAQKAAFSALNDTISTAETDLSEARRIRKEFYDGDAGLRVKMKCTKHAVRSQYGAASPQFAAIRTIAP